MNEIQHVYHFFNNYIYIHISRTFGIISISMIMIIKFFENALMETFLVKSTFNVLLIRYAPSKYL